MMKKIISALLIAGTLASMTAMPALAGNTSYSLYHVNGNSKNQYVTSQQGFNTKAVTGRDWVIKASQISFTDTTTNSYGIAHVLINVNTEDVATNNLWLKQPARKVGTWKYNYGIKGQIYAIGARLDTVLSGQGTTVGVFNSDSY